MRNHIEQMVRSTLGRDSLEDCSLQELRRLAADHPYFGAAQVLLAKKLQMLKDPEYREQLAKASLFFHNPLWLDQLLNERGDAELQPEIAETKMEIATLPPEGKPVAAVTAAASPLLPVPAPLEKTTGKEFLFEPYHTVDYFASQGIRFREEEKPADRFGQQLKSFTEWLKTLKRLPVAEAVASTPEAERKVEQMAENSVLEKEVLTETMAEVWRKQGNPQKAIEIYNKLSLLEPSKSAYFAAKIAELNK
ncbi:MAG TPA: hypothetical protein VEB63_06795 [Chitinophagaceae bacterium]|nr:hypothetical protein [Chitinophagaceae bacterium]